MLVVIVAVNGDVIGETGGFFRRAPSFADQSIDVGPKFCAGVIETEEWIESNFLQFSLTCRGASTA